MADHDLFSLPPLSWPSYFALAIISYLSLASIHRIYFSRISQIPGPRLAALTYYYRSYYDLWPHGGRFLWKAAELHKQYGPVIRIGPDEVHVNDPELYVEMYGTPGKKRDKSVLWYWMEGCGFFADSTFTTIGHEHHRLRRSGISPFFSKKMVQDLEPRVKDKVLLLRKRLLDYVDCGELVDLANAMSGLTLDVVSEYAFGESANMLMSPDMGKPMNDMLVTGVKFYNFGQAFPIIARNLLRLPKWMLGTSPEIEGNTRFMETMDGFARKSYDLALSSDPKADEASTRNAIHSMLHSDSLPEDEKRYERIKADAQVLIHAGTETTGRMLAVMLYHVLADREVYDRLLQELRTVIPTITSPLPSVAVLETLPYLVAVVSEGLRVAHGVSGRLVRTAPDEVLDLHGFKIPRGTTFSQSPYLVHTNADIFREPFSFIPDRWLAEDTAKARKNFHPFGRGSRACLGLNLAYSEMYLTVAALVAGVRMELVDTTVRDWPVVRDYFTGALPEDSEGIRVRVHGLAE